MKTSTLVALGLCSIGASLPLATAKSTEPAASHPTITVSDQTKQSLIDDAIARVYPSLVRIHVVSESPKGGRMQKTGGTGSGTIIHPDGYVLTNHHVAGNASRVWVRLSNKLRVDAQVVGTDPQTDLCVLKLDLSQIPDEMKPLPIAKFGDFSTLEVGDTVLAMGSPAGVSQSVTLGVVANLELIMPGNSGSLLQDGERVGDLVRWIGHDAVIYFGNSGGPLVNLRGEIIGVNEIGLGSLGGAIPADIAKYVADELIANGTVRRSWTGLLAQPTLRSDDDAIGVLTSTVIPDSPGATAGLEAGDIITAFDGVEVNASAAEHLPDFNRLILGTPVGKSVDVKFLRDGKEQSATLTTVERSKALGDNVALTEWGLTARNLTVRSAIAMKRDNTDGVHVTTINATGPAATSKPPLKPGDVILKVAGSDTLTLDDLNRITTEQQTNDSPTKGTIVEFDRDGQLLATVVKLGKQPNDSKSSAASRAWIGLNTQVLTRDLARALDLKGKKGVRVTQVIPDSLADKAELKPGDILLKIDGMVISAERERDASVFDTMIREYSSDDTVEFSLVRDGKEMTLSCQLEPAPMNPKEFRKMENATLEFTARELSKDNATEAAVESGVLVDRVERAGWAALAGLSGGDIILNVDGTEITDLATLETALMRVADEKSSHVVFFIRRGNITRFIEIQPIWLEQD